MGARGPPQRRKSVVRHARHAARGDARSCGTFALEHPANWGAHIEIEGGPERQPSPTRPGERAPAITSAHGRWPPVARLRQLTRGLGAPAAIRADRSYVVTGGFGHWSGRRAGAAIAGARHLTLPAAAARIPPTREEARCTASRIDVVSHRLDVSDAAAVRANHVNHRTASGESSVRYRGRTIHEAVTRHPHGALRKRDRRQSRWRSGVRLRSARC